jgi:hypothetical protein
VVNLWFDDSREASNHLDKPVLLLSMIKIAQLPLSAAVDNRRVRIRTAAHILQFRIIGGRHGPILVDDSESVATPFFMTLNGRRKICLVPRANWLSASIASLTSGILWLTLFDRHRVVVSFKP